MSNAGLMTEFYEAFARRDGNCMAACYHPDARFSDPVFSDLRGPHIGAMWKMLTARAIDLRIEFRDVRVQGNGGCAHWEAWYTFLATGKKVHNIIDARFIFGDGKILTHHDEFDFYGWSRQALGLPGLLLGWTSLLQKKVQAQAERGLRAFERG